MFADVSEALTKAIETDLFNQAKNIIDQALPIFEIGFGIYIILVMWGYYRSGFDETMVDLTKRILGWMMIIAIGLNAGNYQKVAKSVYDAPETVASWVTDNKMDNKFVDHQLNNVDKSIFKMYEFAKKLSTWKIFEKFSLAIGSIVLFLLGYLSILFIWVFYMIAKFSLALTLVVGPIFIGAMLFPSTRQYGMNWIGQCLNYILTVMLYMGISQLQLGYISKTLEKINLNDFSSAVIWEMTGSFVVITIICIPLMLSIPGIVSALTGGASVDSHARGIRSMASMGAAAVSSGATLPFKAYNYAKEKYKNFSKNSISSK